jgi:Fe-S oxidoreductase
LYGTKGMKTIFGTTSQTINEIPSGCCGMAGSFGYEKEHYDISKKIGDEILFPTIRSMKENTIVVEWI